MSLFCLRGDSEYKRYQIIAKVKRALPRKIWIFFCEKYQVCSQCWSWWSCSCRFPPDCMYLKKGSLHLFREDIKTRIQNGADHDTLVITCVARVSQVCLISCRGAATRSYCRVAAHTKAAVKCVDNDSKSKVFIQKQFWVKNSSFLPGAAARVSSATSGTFWRWVAFTFNEGEV